jgi:hypothetical protein
MDANLIVGVMQVLIGIYQIRLASNPSSQTVITNITNISERYTLLPPGSQVRMEEVEQQVYESFSHEEAKIVVSDFRTLMLFSSPPKVESFNYWEMLLSLLSPLIDFCSRNEIFRLRGLKRGNNRFLPMDETSKVIVDEATIATWLAFKNGERGKVLGTKDTHFFLVEGDYSPRLPYIFSEVKSVAPILITATATYRSYYSTGGHSDHEESLKVTMFPGVEPHWISYVSNNESSRCHIRAVRMLKSRDMLTIVEALKRDLHGYCDELISEESFTNDVLEPQLKAVLHQVSNPESRTNDNEKITDEVSGQSQSQ